MTGPSGRLPKRRAVPRGSAKAGYFVSFHGGTGVNFNRIADGHAGCAPDVDIGIALVRGDGQPGVGEAEHVETVSGEFRSCGYFHGREDGLLRWVLGQGPAGNVGGGGASVVKLNEGVRWVNRKLVDLHRADVPHFLDRCPALLATGRLVRPRRVADQVTVVGRGPRRDLEGGGHGGVRCDRISESLGFIGSAGNHGGPALGHRNAQLDSRQRAPRRCS